MRIITPYFMSMHFFWPICDPSICFCTSNEIVHIANQWAYPFQEGMLLCCSLTPLRFSSQYRLFHWVCWSPSRFRYISASQKIWCSWQSRSGSSFLTHYPPLFWENYSPCLGRIMYHHWTRISRCNLFFYPLWPSRAITHNHSSQ